MWLEWLTIRRLALSIFLNVFLFAFGEAQPMNTSPNISSAILTESVSTHSLRSTVAPEISPSTHLMKRMSTFKSKAVLSDSTAMTYATRPTSKLSQGGRKMTTEMLSGIRLTSSSVDFISSSLQRVVMSSNLMIKAQSISAKPPSATKSSTISENYKTIWTNVSPSKSEISMADKSSESPKKSSVVSGGGKMDVTDVGNKTTDTLRDISSGISTGSVSTLSLRSTVVPEISPSTHLMKIMSTFQSKSVLPDSTAMKYATGPTSKLSQGGRKMTTERLSGIQLTSSSFDFISSSLQRVVLSSNLVIKAQSIPAKPPSATKLSTISEDYKTIWTNVSPSKSEISMAIKSSQSSKKSSIVPGGGKMKFTDVGNKTKLLKNVASLNSMQSFVSPSSLKVFPSHIPQVTEIVNSTAPSSIQASKTLKYSDVISSKPLVDASLTFATATFAEKQANMTITLKPSPSLIAKQQPSEVQTTSLSESVKRKDILYSKSSAESILFIRRNDTIVPPDKTKRFLYTSNSLTTVNDTMEKSLEKTMAKDKVTKFSSTPMMRSKNLTVSPSRYTSSDIPSAANRSTIAQYSSMPDRFGKIVNSQSQILTNNTIFGMIQPSTMLSSLYNTLSNRTQISPSMKIKEMPPKNETRLEILTYSSNKMKTSDIGEEKKQYATASSSYIEKDYTTPVPTTAPPIIKLQQFRVTIMILSEEFKIEYLRKSSREFKQKSRRVEAQFDVVFQNMSTYEFTEVLRFFSGSLGCDLVIHTKSKESEPMSVEGINDTLNKAKNTGRFGKYVVGDIKVKEESPDVEGRNEDEKDEKETWGRIPIIVVSVLGGLCFVLIVMVISQCVSTVTLLK